MSESMRYSLSQSIKTTDSFRNEKRDSLWIGHWIFDSLDAFKNTDTFSNISSSGDAQQFSCICLEPLLLAKRDNDNIV